MRRVTLFVLFVAVVVMASTAVVVFDAEKAAPDRNIKTLGDAVWWAMTTVTTVGYGDKYPVSAGGRGVAVVLMLVGIGLIGVLTATVASYFVEQSQDADNAALNQRLDRIERILAQSLSSRRAKETSVGEQVGSGGTGRNRRSPP